MAIADEDLLAVPAEKGSDDHDLESADWKWLMQNAAGRRLFMRLIQRTHVFESSFRLNSESALLEGERKVGLWLISQVTQQHDLRREYLLAQTEKWERDDARRNN